MNETTPCNNICLRGTWNILYYIHYYNFLIVIIVKEIDIYCLG